MLGPVIAIAVLVALGWVFIAVPVRRRQWTHQAMQDDVEVGDEIITAGGLHAVVHETGDSELRIEVAPGVIVTLDRRAVAAVAVAEQGDDTVADAATTPPSESLDQGQARSGSQHETAPDHP